MTFSRSMRIAMFVLGAAAAAGLAAIQFTSTASAGEGKCPEKTLCVFLDSSYSGQMVKIDGKGISNKLAKKMNNEASSVINNRSKRSYLYDKKDGKSEKVCIGPNETVQNLGNVSFNDLASSSKNTKNTEFCPL